MTLPPPIFNDFFRNPFGGEMKPIGGMGGEGGVLENIQQQVSENGEALQALQGGIGGLPNTPFQPATLQPVYGGHRGPGSPGTLQPLIANEIDPSRPSIDFDRIDDILIRFEYDKAVADAKKYRETSPLTQNVLPGEMSFEDFKKNRPGIGFTTERTLSPVAPMPMNPSTDIFNMQTGGPGLMTMPNDLGYTGDTGFYDPRGIPNEKDRIEYGNVGNTRMAGPLDQYGVAQDPSAGMDPSKIKTSLGMDQLFGRAFAGKPI
jgi:hypothetical protein